MLRYNREHDAPPPSPPAQGPSPERRRGTENSGGRGTERGAITGTRAWYGHPDDSPPLVWTKPVRCMATLGRVPLHRRLRAPHGQAMIMCSQRYKARCYPFHAPEEPPLPIPRPRRAALTICDLFCRRGLPPQTGRDLVQNKNLQHNSQHGSVRVKRWLDLDLKRRGNRQCTLHWHHQPNALAGLHTKGSAGATHRRLCG